MLCKKNEETTVEHHAEKRFVFQTLAPIDDANIDVYDEAIDFAFENTKVRNVAISGAYGSGKSSLLASYKKSHPDRRFIHISLAHFEPEYKPGKNVKSESKNELASKSESGSKRITESDAKDKTQGAKTSSNSDLSESVLEGKILNQLIHQLNEKLIPQTNFRVKKTLSKKQVALNAIAIILLFVTVIHLTLSYAWINFVSTFDANCWLRKILVLTTTPVSFLVSGCVGFGIISWFVFSSVKKQRFNAAIRKMSFQGNDIELFEKDNDSFFDKYLNEVLYLFENANVDAIVFEDMDRYDMEGIFERLHEVNTLANIRLSGKSKKPVRFFFLLRDDLFISKDRTKFFDYIIPVIPVVDSSNSYDQFIKVLESNNLRNLFKEKFLQGLSLYIDDMRLLKNICNEFLIYYIRLGSTELDPNKLLAVIAYKNIFPRDFSELQINRGFVYTIFAKKEEFIQDEASRLQKEIGEIQAEIDRLENEHLRDVGEVDAVFVDKHFRDYSLSSYRGIRLTDWIENHLRGTDLAEYRQRRNDVEAKLSGKALVLKQQKQEEQSRLQKLKQKKLTEAINRDNIKEIFSVVSENALGEKTTFEDVKRSQYFDLLKYLIRNGYIDESYADYMTYFYPNSITTADKVFLQSVTNKVAKDYTFELKKPALVFEKLNVYDFNEPETLNFSLLTYMLTYEPAKDCLQHFIAQLRTTEKYDFISQYLSVTPENAKFVTAINAYWPKFFESAVEKHALPEHQLWEYSHDTLYFSSAQDIENVNKGGGLREYISAQPDYLDVSSGDHTALMRGLLQLAVKFDRLDYAESDHNLFMQVYEHSCYVLNYSNIALMLQHVYGIDGKDDIRHKSFSLIASKTDMPLYKYVTENIVEYFNVMLDFCNDKICDNEKSVIYALNNSDLSIKTKIRYLERLETKLSVLSEVTEKTLWGTILDLAVVDYNENNIWDYWKENGIDETLSAFINNGSVKLDFESLIDKNGNDAGEKWFGNVMACNKICTDKYIPILQSCGFYYSDDFAIMGIAEEKMEQLIDNALVQLSAESLKFIRKNYPTLQNRFIEEFFDDYVKIMTQSLFSHEELLEVLSWNVPDEQKLTLLAFASQKISIVGKGYSTAVTLYILQNLRDVEDMPFLFQEYSKLANEIKPIVVSYAESKINDIINGSIKSSDALNLELLGDSKVSEINKNRLLLMILSGATKQLGRACFDRLQLDEFSKIFDSHAKPKIIKSEQNKKILDVLVNRGWIYDYPDYPHDEAFYTVRRNAPSKKRELSKV